MTKAYDRRYFDTWYRQRSLGGKAALTRKVALAVALAEYHLGTPGDAARQDSEMTRLYELHHGTV